MSDAVEAGGLEMLLDRLPVEVVASFTPEQRAALWNAVKPTSWRRHPIHIRLSFPFIGGNFFLTVVGGMEKRSGERRARERRMFPLRTMGNILFLLGLGGAFYAVAIIGIFVFSNLIEF
ncbi:hypothetical protein [Magnetospirillum sulfuroxidans]|uniref:Uncharacterized protein n=1 Tax=Magnetospirillum sulfuroxidans TaxID=611300 RepID=A0ABS5IGT7_9PROT|nr:hypothetical protein [Magnetospirillum sulfuroxidans]MBR9973641.1 hypothetical protein [Magnetospirillum sulfuroxidans]